MTIDLTADDIQLLSKALDAYAYWELAEDHTKRDGFVMDDQTEDEEIKEQLDAIRELDAKITAALPEHQS